MIKFILLIIVVLLSTSCTSFRTTGDIVPNPETTAPTPVKSVEPKNSSAGKYDIDLNQELTYKDEVSQINQLNQMSIDTNNKTSQQQLMLSLIHI